MRLKRQNISISVSKKDNINIKSGSTRVFLNSQFITRRMERYLYLKIKLESLQSKVVSKKLFIKYWVRNMNVNLFKTLCTKSLIFHLRINKSCFPILLAHAICMMDKNQIRRKKRYLSLGNNLKNKLCFNLFNNKYSLWAQFVRINDRSYIIISFSINSFILTWYRKYLTKIFYKTSYLLRREYF